MHSFWLKGLYKEINYTFIGDSGESYRADAVSRILLNIYEFRVLSPSFGFNFTYWRYFVIYFPLIFYGHS